MHESLFINGHPRFESRLCSYHPDENPFRDSRKSHLFKDGSSVKGLRAKISSAIKNLSQVGKDSEICTRALSSSQERLSRDSLVSWPMDIAGSKAGPLEVPSSQAGFITLAGLGLISSLILCFGGAGVLGHLLKEKMKLSSHCVHKVL
ncbi:MAG: hypothetical protein GW917_00955, partial [Bdellovibrionales bacterium]|nr:hypothetical protein [Bdellovibrionales bacterium]